MSDPMGQPRQEKQQQEQRRSDQEKVLAVLDLARVVVFALFKVFGRRRNDP